MQSTCAGMAVFLRNVSFHGILLDALFSDDNEDWQTVFDLVTAGLKDKTVQPLQTTVFERDDIESAFRFMAQGKHVGKVVIKAGQKILNYAKFLLHSSFLILLLLYLVFLLLLHLHSNWIYSTDLKAK